MPGLVLLKNTKMKPMGQNFTPFLSFNEIKTDGTDLIDDAWGFRSRFGDVMSLLDRLDPEPQNALTDSLILKIRQQI